jgi:hypothetical protein
MAYPKLRDNELIQSVAINGQGVFLAPGKGFRSLKHFHDNFYAIIGRHEPWIEDTYDLSGMTDLPPGFARKYQYWRRDSMAAMTEILQNPRFGSEMVFAGEKLYDDTNGHRVFGEMNTANFWLECEKRLHEGGRTPGSGSFTLVPFLLSSDKAVFGNMSGQRKGWPLLLTVGNIPSEKRFLLSESNTRMIALLPTFYRMAPVKCDF